MKTKLSTYKSQTGNNVIMVSDGNSQHVTYVDGDITVYIGEDGLCGATDMTAALRIAGLTLSKDQVNELTGMMFQ